MCAPKILQFPWGKVLWNFPIIVKGEIIENREYPSKLEVLATFGKIGREAKKGDSLWGKVDRYENICRIVYLPFDELEEPTRNE